MSAAVARDARRAGDDFAGELDDAVCALLTQLGGLAPATLTPGACARLATTLSRAANACTTAAARCTARAPEPAVGRAEWLARVSGATTDQARRALDTVASVPVASPTGNALATGEVSVAQAAAIASVPEHEHELLDTARHGSLRAVRDAARERRLAAIEPERLAAKQRAARSFSHWTDDLGMVCFRGALPPIEGTMLVNRIDTLTDRISRAAWRACRPGRTTTSGHAGSGASAGTRRGAPLAAAVAKSGADDGEATALAEPEARAAYAADALLQLLAAATPDARPVPPRGASTEIVIIADLTALTRGRVESGEACRILGEGPIPVSAVRELATDAFIKAVLHDGTRVHTVAHYGRNRPAHLRTALMLGAPPGFPGTVCVIPGCERR
ncbi:MAG: DUF222 domain-containing protein, partial [Actinomycetota bacterium]